MDSQSDDDTEEYYDLSDEHFPLLEEHQFSEAISQMKEKSYAMTEQSYAMTKQSYAMTEQSYAMTEQSYTMTELLSRWLIHITQSILHYNFYIAICVLLIIAAILAYASMAILHRHSNDHRDSSLESLPGFTTLGDSCAQLVTSLKGEFNNALMDGYDVASEEACGMESTLKSNPNRTYFIMILSSTPTSILKRMRENKGELYNLIAKYGNVILLNIDVKSYFSATPLFNDWTKFRSNSHLIQFNARLLTIRQIGSTTHFSRLITLRNASISALPDTRETLFVDVVHGGFINEKQKCNAILFEVFKMMALNASTETFEREVLALVSLCNDVETIINNGSVNLKLACNGVTGLPPGLLCLTNQSDPGCSWGSWRRSASEFAVQCPVTAMRIKAKSKE